MMKEDDSSVHPNSDPSASNFTEENYSSEERDELDEVRKISSKETKRIRLWRIVLTVCLLATAAVITGTTFVLLKQEQDEAFVVAYEQFSRTVSEALMEQQYNIREGYKYLADTISNVVLNSEKLEWPFFNMDNFEVQGQDFLIQSGAEFVAMHPLVKRDQQDAWIEFLNKTYEASYMEGHMIKYGHIDRLDRTGYKPFISKAGPDGFTPDIDRDYYFPSWLNSPPASSYRMLNWNVYSVSDYGNVIEVMLALQNETISSPVRPYSVAVGSIMTPEEHAAMHSKYADTNLENPHTFFFHPIRENTALPDSPVVGVIGGAVAWDRALLDLLPSEVRGIQTVITNNCNQSYTYEIDGRDAFFLGEGDRHDPLYDSMEVLVDAAPHTHPAYTSTPGHCQYKVHIYPTKTFHSAYQSQIPEIYAAVIASTFGIIILVFFIYDVLVAIRNNKLLENTARSNAIVSSLFPSNIRDRLIGHNVDSNPTVTFNVKSNKNLKSYMKNADSGAASNHLADLFVDTTVVFADIVGFTAWSSVREPTAVFQLLERLYGEFDIIAKRRRVFKVETVGDCYVAVTGLPDPNPLHAISMARFAHEILEKLVVVTRELEVTLGPDTGELNLRVGIHSGPVTAGVLRGERARFQLFGDTMNTTARLESTSIPGRIHLSKETADLLVKGGKGGWVQAREDKVVAKGKGELTTFWLNIEGTMNGASVDNHEAELRKEKDKADKKKARLIDWNVEKLVSILKEIVAHREGSNKSEHALQSVQALFFKQKKGTPLEEVKEIIELPEFNTKKAGKQKRAEEVVIPENVIEQLRDYVTNIANMYRDNPFHNFEHASHVVMSVCKLMTRIVAPDIPENDDDDDSEDHKVAAKLHDHTYGITSDPLTRFSAAFSALIHDVDHTGVPNNQLVAENGAMARKYNERSVAEQNSLDISWDLLIQDKYKDLLQTLCATTSELQRFRSLVVNSVMSTDIMDKDLKQLRNARWDKAFKDCTDQGTRTAVNRKATIVIEHLIQASDVSHTMQHWHIYRKWNERLFREMYRAYREGRAEKNPAECWYKGEIGFFDFYIIPLAKKLKDCGVFGVSSDEYLNYAEQNRREWEFKGEEVVASMIDAIKEEELQRRGSHVELLEQAPPKPDFNLSTYSV